MVKISCYNYFVVRNLLLLGMLLTTIGAGVFFWKEGTYTFQNSPVGGSISPPSPTPLIKYSFNSLKNREYPGSEIKLERKLNEEDKYTSYTFSFTSEGKKITGQANLPASRQALPNKSGKLPVIVMLRGYIDKEVYFTGLGTHKAAGFFAENGFITLAPDFLGFGGSDWESSDILEARFEKPITALNLIESIKSLPQADTKNIFIWGHSNGGQIALSVLEISGRSLPTSLWAPITRSFPQSVTDYIGEMDDQGRMVVASISAFLEIYNPIEFSITTYLQDINAPLQIHQGKRDSLVKEEWTDEFVDKIKNLGKKIKYFTYSRDDHNLSRNWDTVVARDIKFFNSHLKYPGDS